MNSKEFKSVFDQLAKAAGFEKEFGGWFSESQECITVLDLQKSNYGDYYELNIKIFIRGLFGNDYRRGKELVKKLVGNVFRRQPPEYSESLALDNNMNDSDRRLRLEALFRDYLVPFAKLSSSRHGIKELEQKGEIFLLPAVKAGLSA